MRALLICFLIILISTVVYAKDVFPDRELKRLQLIQVDVNAGKAWIQDADGNEAEISTGDTIGTERGIIIQIDEASITVQMGNTRTKMPVVYGFE
mgnify:FL=1